MLPSLPSPERDRGGQHSFPGSGAHAAVNLASNPQPHCSLSPRPGDLSPSHPQGSTHTSHSPNTSIITPGPWCSPAHPQPQAAGPPPAPAALGTLAPHLFNSNPRPPCPPSPSPDSGIWEPAGPLTNLEECGTIERVGARGSGVPSSASSRARLALSDSQTCASRFLNGFRFLLPPRLRFCGRRRPSAPRPGRGEARGGGASLWAPSPSRTSKCGQYRCSRVIASLGRRGNSGRRSASAHAPAPSPVPRRGGSQECLKKAKESGRKSRLQGQAWRAGTAH